jgi:hypothetical protein
MTELTGSASNPKTRPVPPACQCRRFPLQLGTQVGQGGLTLTELCKLLEPDGG